jgi:hypothetical protein
MKRVRDVEEKKKGAFLGNKKVHSRPRGENVYEKL